MQDQINLSHQRRTPVPTRPPVVLARLETQGQIHDPSGRTVRPLPQGRPPPLGRQSQTAHHSGTNQGRPCECLPGIRQLTIKPIWFAALQSCDTRLVALRSEWLSAYDHDHRRLDAEVHGGLLAVATRALDRLLLHLRVSLRRRGETRPGSTPRQSIRVRGDLDRGRSGLVGVGQRSVVRRSSRGPPSLDARRGGDPHSLNRTARARKP